MDKVNSRTRCLLSLIAAGLFFMGPALGVLGESQTKFSGNVPDMTITFPKIGGFNTSISVDLPKQIIITAASMDVTGSLLTFDPISATIDFNNPGMSTAFEGSTSNIPPNQPPLTFETTNRTAHAGLKASDDSYLVLDQKMSYITHLFKFYVGYNLVNSFNFRWEGNGYSEGDVTMEGVDLYIYHGANTWDMVNSTSLTGGADETLWVNFTTNASGFVDSKGYLDFLVTTRTVTNFYYAHLATDYVSFAYTGTERCYPTILRLDVGADGSTEWGYNGTLNDTQSFSGQGFVEGLQRVCDASPTDNVNIKLRFQSMSGGTLKVDNLTIIFDRKDLPPRLVGPIIVPALDEDTNATGLADLTAYFSDDKGAENMTYTIVYKEDDTKLDAQLSGGHHLDFATKTANWFGALRFRVVAEDAAGQRVESANFTVTVRPVNDAPKLRGIPLLVAHEGAEFVYNLNASDVDTALVPDETLTFSTSAPYMTLNPDTGRMSFTPRNSDVGPHVFTVTVTDLAGANDTKSVSLNAENTNNPPALQSIDDVTIYEDEPFSMRVNATDPDLDIGLDELTFEDNTSLFQIAKNGTIAFTPQNKDVGVQMVSVSVKDSGGLTDTVNFTITVVNVNDAPRILPVANMTVKEDERVSFKVNATDEDVGDVLSFKDDSSLVDITAAGLVNFTPLQKDVGDHTFNITVTDAGGLKASFKMTIIVLNVNEPPVARIKNPANGTSYNFGANITFEGSATDEDGDELAYSWSDGGVPLGMGQSFATKKLKAGKHTISLTVSDGTVEVPGGTIEITVKAKKPAEKGLPGFELGLALLGLAAAAVHGRRRH